MTRGEPHDDKMQEVAHGPVCGPSKQSVGPKAQPLNHTHQNSDRGLGGNLTQSNKDTRVHTRVIRPMAVPNSTEPVTSSSQVLGNKLDIPTSARHEGPTGLSLGL